MNKTKIIAVALGLLLLFSSGCSLSDADKVKTAEQDKNKTIIEYKDLKITKDQVTMKMNKYLTSQGMSIADLQDEDDAAIWERFKNDIIQELAVDHMALEKAAELGLDKLSADEQSTLDKAYQDSVSKIESTVSASVKADMASDKSLDYDTEYKRQLDEYYYLQGYSVDTYRQDLTNEYIVQKFKESLTKDVTVTDEQVRSYYDSNLKMQESSVKKSPESVEQQMSFGSTVLYYPDGYMDIRHLLISYDSDTRGSAAIAYADGKMTEYNQIITDALPTIQAKIDEVTAKMDAGEDFTKLIDEYNEDTSVDEEPFRTKGFAVGPYTTNIDIPGYMDAVNTLKEPGQYVTVNSYYGCYIIRCEKLLAGPVPFEDVKDSFKESLLKQNKDLEWSKTTQGWVDAAKADGTLKIYIANYS
jgi:foldase protein PrsA